MAWAKLHTDILGDPKLMRAARKGAAYLTYLPWLIVFAKEADDDGRLSVNGDPAEADDIAPLIPCATVEGIAQCMAELESIGILIRDSDSVLVFAQWDHRSGSKASDEPEAIRARVRKHRDNRKRAKGNGVSVTSGNALPVTTPETLCNALEEEEDSDSESYSESSSSRDWLDNAARSQQVIALIRALGGTEYAADIVDRFLARCPSSANAMGWVARVGTYIDGTRARIAGERVTPEHILAALDDHTTNSAPFNADLLHKYVQRAMRGADEIGNPKKAGRLNAGDSTYLNGVAAMKALGTRGIA